MPNIANTLIKILRSLEALQKCNCNNNDTTILNSIQQINTQINTILNLLDHISITESDPIFTAWLNTNPLAGFLTSENDPSFNAWLLTDPLPHVDGVTITGSGTTLDPYVATISPTYIRRSDYILVDKKSYLGVAINGSLETDAVWTIWVTVTNNSGEVVSNTQYLNKKWSERNLL